jgi:hypothetical protein
MDLINEKTIFILKKNLFSHNIIRREILSIRRKIYKENEEVG